MYYFNCFGELSRTNISLPIFLKENGMYSCGNFLPNFADSALAEMAEQFFMQMNDTFKTQNI